MDGETFSSCEFECKLQWREHVTPHWRLKNMGGERGGRGGWRKRGRGEGEIKWNNYNNGTRMSSICRKLLRSIYNVSKNYNCFSPPLHSPPSLPGKIALRITHAALEAFSIINRDNLYVLQDVMEDGNEAIFYLRWACYIIGCGLSLP